MSSRAAGLDLIRVVAVASVLVAHGSQLFGTFAAVPYLLAVFGVAGVEIFFALSGFLVGRQLLLVSAGEADAGAFLLRRWYRTLPNYYLFLALNAVLAWTVLASVPAPRASYLVFSQSLAWPAAAHFFPESWSLAVEEWFYAIGAGGFAIAALCRAGPRAVGLALLGVVIAWPLLRYAAQAASAIPIDAGVRKIVALRLDALAFGLGCAWMERYRRPWFDALCGPLPRLAALGLAALAMGGIALQSRRLDFLQRPAPDDVDRWIASLLFTVLPLAAALWLPWLSRWSTWRSWLQEPVRMVSDWSYSIYLTHVPLLLLLTTLWIVERDDPVQLGARAAVWLACSVGLAALVFRYYERPLTLRRPPLRRMARSPVENNAIGAAAGDRSNAPG